MANIDITSKIGFPSPKYIQAQASSLNPAVVNAVYVYDMTSGPYTLTLPTGTTAALVGVVNKNGTASATLYLDVAPGAGGTIRGAADTYRFRYPNFSAYFYRELGSSDWQIDFDIATLASTPGQVPGYTGGSAIPAGMIGETITWTTAPASQATTTTLADWTNATFTLSAGVWMLYASIQASATCGTTLGDQTTARVVITDSGGTTINNWDKRISVTQPSTGTARIFAPIPFSGILNISASTTYKIMVQKQDIAGTGSGDVRFASSDYSQFFAVRIA